MSSKQMQKLFNLISILEKDDLQQNIEHQVKEKEKVGTFRAGNSGIVLPDKQIAGKCHRKTLLRFLEIEIPVPKDRNIMFEMGIYNEKIIMEKLGRSLGNNYKIIAQDEAGTKWLTDNNIPVTGSPDTLILAYDNKPILGIEMKCVSSLWTAIDVLMRGKPKFDHLCQTAHYMWQTKIPFKLLYVNYADYQCPFFRKGSELGDWVPDRNSELAKHIDWNKQGNPKKILPFRTAYDLQWRSDGYLEFRNESESGYFTSTPITAEGIKQYYNQLEKFISEKSLGDRPLNLDCTGALNTFNLCDPAYCELSHVCDSYEKHYDLWVDACRKECDKLKIERR